MWKWEAAIYPIERCLPSTPANVLLLEVVVGSQGELRLKIIIIWLHNLFGCEIMSGTYISYVVG